MTTPRLALALALALVAIGGCGDDLAPRLHISAAGSDLLAIDRGHGWEPLALDATGRVTVDLDGPYALANVCGAQRATTARLGGVRAADEDLDLDCVGAPAPTVPVTVTLTSQAFAAVYVGRTMFLVFADRPRTLDVEPGPADLVVYASATLPPEPLLPSRGGIVRRGVEVRAGLALAFDPTTEAIDFVPHPHAIPAGDGVQAWWHTVGGGIASLPADGSTIRVPPPAVRRAGDTYYAQRSVTDGDLSHTRSVAFDPDATAPIAPIAIELAAPFQRVDFATAGPPAATWIVPDAAAWPEATLYVADTDATGNATASWQVTVDRTARPDEDPAALAMPDVTAIAGWQAAWDLTSPAPQRALTVRRPGPGAAEESMTVWRR